MENSPVAISGQLPRFHIGPSDPYAAFGLIDLDTSYPIHVDVEVLFSLYKVSHAGRLSSYSEIPDNNFSQMPGWDPTINYLEIFCSVLGYSWEG
jgi:hypothetical protein